MREKLNSYSVRFFTTLFLCGVFVSPSFRAATVSEQTELNCFTSLMTAMRAWNYPKFKETLQIADEFGIIQSWQKEYCQNLLDGCDRNAIVFTNNLRDTLPLMYLQHVERIRQDVAILPVTFLDDPWYLNLLKQDDQFICNKPGVGLNRREIIQLSTQDILPDLYEFHLPQKVCKKYQIDSSQNVIILNIAEGWYSSQSNYYSKSIKLLLNLLAENQWRRPVFVSSVCDSAWLQQIQDRLRCEGLVYRVIPFRNPEQTMDFNWQKIALLMKDADHFIHYREAFEQSVSVTDTCFLAYSKLAIKWIQHRQRATNPQDIQKILSILSENIGFSYIPAPGVK